MRKPTNQQLLGKRNVMEAKGEFWREGSGHRQGQMLLRVVWEMEKCLYINDKKVIIDFEENSFSGNSV